MDRHRIDGPFARIVLSLAPAVWQRRVVAAVYLLSLLPVWLSDIGVAAAVALSVALAWGLAANLRRLDPAAPGALRVLELLPDGRWRLTFADGRQVAACLVSAVVGDSGWCWLRLRTADGREHTELLHPGRCDPQALRRLRVRLRLDPLLAPGAAALGAGDP